MSDTLEMNLPDVGSADFLTDYPEEKRAGLWPRGWAQAVIVPSFTTPPTDERPTGTTFETADTVSQNGTSRNLQIRAQVTNLAGESRNLGARINYVPAGLTKERRDHVIAVRTAAKNANGGSLPKKWGAPGEQRDDIAFANLKHLFEFSGGPIPRNGSGGFEVDTITGRKGWVYVNQETNDKGRTFNVISDFAATIGEGATKI